MSTSNALRQRHAELADQLTTEQRGVLAFIDGMLMEQVKYESAELWSSPYSKAHARSRLRAAFPFLEDLPDVS